MAWIPRWRKAAVVLLLSAALSPFASIPTGRPLAVAHAEDFIQLMVSPTLSEHGDMLVQVLVARDADNQLMVVSAESTGYYSASEMELEGEYSPRIRTIRFRSL